MASQKLIRISKSVSTTPKPSTLPVDQRSPSGRKMPN